MKTIIHFILMTALFAFFLSPMTARATGGPSFSYEGRAFNADGTPLETPATFKIQVLSPSPTGCLMYEETRAIDLTGSNGYFTLALNDGSSTPTYYGGLLSLPQVFANNGAALTFSTCASGSNYTPGANDGRSLVVSIATAASGGAFEALPAIAMGSVPFAMEASQVQGFNASSLVRATSGAAPAFNATDIAELAALVAGTSTHYATTSSTAPAGTVIATRSTVPSAPVAGSLWYDTVSGHLKMWNGSAAVQVDSAGTGINALNGDVIASGSGAVSATVAIVGSSTAANIHAAELAANAATNINTSSTIVKRDASGNFAANVATLTGLTLTNIGNVTLSSPAGANYSLTVPPNAGTAGQFLASNGTGATLWTPALTPGTGFMNGGNAFGAAATLGTADAYPLNFSTNNVAKMTLLPNGNVGIGTASPAAALDVVGPARAGSVQVTQTATVGSSCANVGTIELNAANGMLAVCGPGLVWLQVSTGGGVINGSTTIDFAQGNIATTSVACGTPMSLWNLRPGQVYRLLITGSSSTSCSFSFYSDAGVTPITARTNTTYTSVISKFNQATLTSYGSYVVVEWQSNL